MPVLSDRADVIVITDEAHRSQYDTLALNMRNALPNAGFIGFTGTPLIAGEEERTREVFGDYVSDLQLPRLDRGRRDGPAVLREPHPRAAARQRGLRRRAGRDLSRQAELDEDAGDAAGAPVRPSEYQLITRAERLRADRRRPRAALRRPRLRRQGDVRRRSTRRPRCACTTRCSEQWQTHLAELRGRARRAARAGARQACRRRSRSWRRPTWPWSSPRRRTRSPTCEKQGLDITPAPPADDRRGPRRASSRIPTTRCGSCSSARCG